MKIEHIIKYGEKPKPDIVLGEGLREVTLSPKERRRLPKEKETLALRNEKKDAKKEVQIGMEEVQEREDIRGLVKDEKKFLKESEYKNIRTGDQAKPITVFLRIKPNRIVVEKKLGHG